MIAWPTVPDAPVMIRRAASAIAHYAAGDGIEVDGD